VESENSFLVTGATDESLYPLLELAAREQHPPAAGEAFNANVSAQAHDFPGITPAGMGFAQAHYVAQVYV